MKNKCTSFVQYLFSVATLFVAGLSATFAEAQQVGFYPMSIPPSSSHFGYGVGDLNNDGNDDIVTITYDGTAPIFIPPRGGFSRYQRMALQSFVNATDGSFRTPIILPTNFYTFQSYDRIGGGGGFFIRGLIDINGDGKLDVCLKDVIPDSPELQAGAASNSLATESVCYLGMGDGSVNPNYIKLTLPTTPAFSNAVFADLNGDGKADYIAPIPSATGFDIAISYGDGSGGFSASPSVKVPVTTPSGSTLTRVMSFSIFDINRDGRKDIIFMADNPTALFANEQSLHVMTANTGGGYQDTIFDSFHSSVPTEKHSGYRIADTQANGTIALWLLPYNFNYSRNEPAAVSSGSTKVYFSNNQGSFDLVPSLSNKYPAFFGDFNQDGIVDVVTYLGLTLGATLNVQVDTFQQNVGLGSGQFTDGSIFYKRYDRSGFNSPTLVGPYRFGVGGKLGFLAANYNITMSTNIIEPYTVLAGAQKMITETFIQFPGTFAAGQSFTLNANIYQAGYQSLVNGTGTFKIDGVPVGTVAVNNGIATINNISVATSGVRTLSFNYDGDSLNAASQGSYQLFFSDPISISSISNVSVREGEKAVFNVKLSAPTTANTGIVTKLIGSTATINSDFSTAVEYSDDGGATYTTLNTIYTLEESRADIKIGVSSFLLRVTTLTDTLDEGDETFSLTLSPLYYLVGGNVIGTGTIQNKPVLPPLPKITAVSDSTVKEGQKAKFTVSFSAATAQVATLKLSLIDVTTTGALDYSTTFSYSDNNGATYKSMPSGGTATIRIGTNSVLVRVETFKDAIDESAETFRLLAEPLTGLSPEAGSGIGTIINKPVPKNWRDRLKDLLDDLDDQGGERTSRIRDFFIAKQFTARALTR